MITDENKTELIDRFLSGTLDDVSLRLVKQRMEEDATFREEVALQQALTLHIRQHNRLEMKKRLAAISDEQQPRRIWWAAAAVLVIAGAYGIGKYLSGNKTQPLAETRYTIPVQEADSAALGFGKQTVTLDSIALRIIETSREPESYLFSDTLTLYVSHPPVPPIHWTVYYRPADQRYFLQTDSVVYQLEKGFNYPRALIRASF